MLSKRATVSLTLENGGLAGEPLSSIDIVFETVCNVYILLNTQAGHPPEARLAWGFAWSSSQELNRKAHTPVSHDRKTWSSSRKATCRSCFLVRCRLKPFAIQTASRETRLGGSLHRYDKTHSKGHDPHCRLNELHQGVQVSDVLQDQRGRCRSFYGG